MVVTSSFNKAAVAAVAFAATGTQAYRLGADKDVASAPLQANATKIKNIFEKCSLWKYDPENEEAMENMKCVVVQGHAENGYDTQTCIKKLDDIEIAAADIVSLYNAVDESEKPQVRCHLAGMEHIKKEMDSQAVTFKEEGTTEILFRVKDYLDAKARELNHNLTQEELEENLEEGVAEGFVAADGEVETEIKEDKSADMGDQQNGKVAADE